MVGVDCTDEFFFLGFFECLPRFCTTPISIPSLGLDYYKPSTPPFSIKCLKWLIGIAEGQAEHKERTQELWTALETEFGVLKDKARAGEGSQSKPGQNAEGSNRTASKGKEVEVIEIDD
jgi:hypothetical protein